MRFFGFWFIGGLAITSAALASLETKKFLTIANGVAQSGLVAANRVPDVLPPPSVQNKVTDVEKSHHTVAQLTHFVQEVEQLWDDAQFSSPSQLVQYSADKRTRSLIDFKEGKLIIEHLASPDAELIIHRVLTNALLTPEDPRMVDLLSTQVVSGERRPFLLGQVVDSLGKSIDSLAKAQTFAAWAIVHKMQQVQTASGPVQRIELALDANHKQVRAARFAHLIEAAAQEFGLDVNLLYAIMETESHFNPFAVSRTGALGLMQIMPERAGRDAMKVLIGEERTPTRAELLDPKTNIRLGAAYLTLLSGHYLSGLNDQKAKDFVVIAAYNSGPSRTLQVFDRDMRVAMAQINGLSAEQVYVFLKNYHTSPETRNYVQKVHESRNRFKYRV